MIEHEVVFTSAGLRLSATLTVPGGHAPRPCVLLMGGSGQVDGDENHKRFPINVMSEMAHHLAARGVASLRYDKRGVARSEGDYWQTGFYDNIADATTAMAFLSSRDEVEEDKIFLLGHSEGAYIATSIAAAAATVDATPSPGGAGSPAGVVLLAGGARNAEEELVWQARQVADSLTGLNAYLIKLLRIDVTKSQRKQIDRIKRSRSNWFRVQLLNKVNAKWMRELLAYDPAKDLPLIRVPVLAITGSKDIQVSPDNLERMASLLTAPFEAHVLSDVTHLLRRETGPGGIGTYKKQVRPPMDERVPTLIGDWLERQINAP